jgi:hypothetical protein
MQLNETSTAALLLWTILRWERSFLLHCLEDLGVDMWTLTCEVDRLLQDCGSDGESTAGRLPRPDPWSFTYRDEIDNHLLPWLDRAEWEARLLGHGYLGTEHLLLAILARAHEPTASLLSRFGIHYDHLKNALLEVLQTQPTVAIVEAEEVSRQPPVPWGVGWDTKEAIGVPRRFGIGIMLLLVALFAVVFAVMQLLNAPTTVFVMVAVLFAGVGLGQVVLFGGQYPRAASVWTGACLVPLEILVASIYAQVVHNEFGGGGEAIVGIFIFVLFSIPLGAGLGYLSGGVTAGVVLLLERYLNWRRSREESESEERGQ